MGDYQPLLIRFRGICAHLDLNPPSGAARGKKRKRTLLVRHRNGSSNIEPHVPYIECLADDIVALSPGLRMLQYSRPGTDGRFGRIDLLDQPDSMTIIRINKAPAGDVTEDLSYEENTPHFSKILKNRSNAKPVDALRSTPLPADVKKFATAVFDMPEGTLVAGEPEAMTTRFDSGPAKATERRFSRWSDLYVQKLPKGKVTVELEQRSNGETSGEKQTITFKETVRMITIGNEPERLIVGLIGGSTGHDHATGNGHGNGNGHGPIQPTGHFILYYDILKNPPSETPMPVPSQLEGTGCPNNNFP